MIAAYGNKSRVSQIILDLACVDGHFVICESVYVCLHLVISRVSDVHQEGEEKSFREPKIYVKSRK